MLNIREVLRGLVNGIDGVHRVFPNTAVGHHTGIAGQALTQHCTAMCNDPHHGPENDQYEKAMRTAREALAILPELFEYRVTFGVKYATEEHPTFGTAGVDRGYFIIEAPDEASARALAFALFGDRWAFLYDVGLYGEANSETLPLGEIGRATIHNYIRENH